LRDSLLKFAGDLLGIRGRFESNRGANLDFDLVGTGGSASGMLQFEKVVNAYGDDRDPQVFHEQANTGTEGAHVAVGGVTAFGEDEDAEAAVHGFSGESEAVAEAGFAGERENVEQGDAEEPFDSIEESEEEISSSRRSAEGLQCFASGGGCEFVTNARGQGGEYEANVNVADVIADDEHWAVQAAQIFATLNSGPAQNKDRGT